MKLNESKERIPATFITTYISDAWDKIGYINADIEAVKKAYSDTKSVTDCLQMIVDAYLIAAGKLQAILDKKDYVDFDVVEQEAKEEKEEVKENLQETLQEKVEDEIQEEPIKPVEDEPISKPIIQEQVELTESLDLSSDQAKSEPAEQFGYFCDFDEPEITAADQATFEAIRQANNQ